MPGHAAAFEARPAARLRELSEPARPDPGLLTAGQPHLEEVRRRSPGLHDGPILALDRIEGDELLARPARYLGMVATADALLAEWERDGAGPMRRRAHDLAGPDPLRSGLGRVAGIGLSVAVAHGGRVLLGRRSAALATDPGRWHVVPAGTLEPAAPVARQVARELDEELGVAAAGSPRTLGVGFDLGRVRPELCLALELADPVVTPAGGEVEELAWIDPGDDWPAPLAPAAAATLALLSATLSPGS